MKKGDIMRKFSIRWQDIPKCEEPNIRTSNITLSKPTGDIWYNAKAALNILCNRFGNLHKIEIHAIQEVDKENNPIGEVIKPTGESSVVPVSKDIKTK